MMDEYILSQLKKVEFEREDLSERLERLCSQEERANHEITELLKDEDVGLELFSPRTHENTAREKIKQIKKHIEELQYEQREISDLINQNRREESKWRQLLEDASANETQENISEKVEAEQIVPPAETGTSVDSVVEVKETEISVSDSTSQNKEEKSVEPEENASKSGVYDSTLEMEREAYVQQLKMILSRVDHCIEYVHSDRIKCKNELKSISHYLKALIVSKDKK